MKHGRSGMSVAEVCIASLIVGLLYAALANSVTGVSRHNGRLLSRMSAMSWITSLTTSLANPEVLKTVVLEEHDSSKLKDCLQRGCPVGTEGTFVLSESEVAPSMLKVTGRFEMLNATIAELKVSFDSDDVFLRARTVKILVSRRSFIPSPKYIPASSCGVSVGFSPKHIVGFDGKAASFICRTLYLGESAAGDPVRMPAGGLGRKWER